MRVLSLYIHVPFCTRRCSYCSFFHVQSIAESQDAYVAALEDELDATLTAFGEPRLRTVFIGGGTPSVLDRESLERVFGTFRAYIDTETTEEVTVELNPEDVTLDLVTFLRDQGVTRLSLGIQSMDAIAQKVLKRCPPEQNLVAVDIARRVFDNISFDVLIGVPGSSMEIFRNTLDTLSALGPEHFSVYCLEPGGDMSHEVEKFFSAVDSDRVAEEYLFTCEHLRNAGYEHYELSNFALPGRVSIHNSIYWGEGDYLGAGPGAHSFVDGERFSNLPSLEEYLAHRGQERPARRVVDGGVDRGLERLMLGLRTANGIPRTSCRCTESVLEELAAADLVELEGERVRLTDEGYLVLNDIVLRISGEAGPNTSRAVEDLC